MNVFPAIDIFEGKAVRLFKGDYNEMTVYSDNPARPLSSHGGSGGRKIRPHSEP